MTEVAASDVEVPRAGDHARGPGHRGDGRGRLRRSCDPGGPRRNGKQGPGQAVAPTACRAGRAATRGRSPRWRPGGGRQSNPLRSVGRPSPRPRIRRSARPCARRRTSGTGGWRPAAPAMSPTSTGICDRLEKTWLALTTVLPPGPGAGPRTTHPASRRSATGNPASGLQHHAPSCAGNTREGYTHGYHGSPIFDYIVRSVKKGELLKTFGGVSSVPDPLIKLHKRIDAYLFTNAGRTWNH